MKLKLNLLLFSAFFCSINIFTRSIYRELESELPSITVHQSTSPSQSYILIDSHLRHFPIFEAYNPTYLETKKLPTKSIAFRNKSHLKVSGKKLSSLIEELLKTIIDKNTTGKTTFKRFIVLKKKDFNFKNKCGLIVFKFKDYPFVVKIFIETPRSITKPFSKGLFPMGMFVMGGTNRHLNGFTRIKNAEDIKYRLQKCTQWCTKLSIPRKWFWMPKKPTWLHIKANNVGGIEVEKTKIPAIYAIIADEIVAATDQSKKRTQTCLAVCRDLEFITDPHYSNFRIEKGTNKFVLYDTEHFPTLIGKYATKMRPTQKYVGWYTRLARKYLKEQAFSSKASRHKRQNPGSVYPLY